MGIQTLNVVEALKKQIIQIEEHCRIDFNHLLSKGDLKMVSVADKDVILNFDIQCILDDGEKTDLIEKIEDYTNPSFDISSEPVIMSEISSNLII